MWSLACTDGNYTKAERVDFHEKMSSLQSFSLFTIADFFTRTTGFVESIQEREGGEAFHKYNLNRFSGSFMLNKSFPTKERNVHRKVRNVLKKASFSCNFKSHFVLRQQTFNEYFKSSILSWKSFFIKATQKNLKKILETTFHGSFQSHFK